MQSILTVALTALFYLHPFYVSVTDIHHNQEAQTLECTIKTFASDIEVALKDKGFGDLSIGTDKELAKTDSIINIYLNDVFQFKLNGEEHTFNFLGKEVEEDVAWIYLEIGNVKELTSIEITNKLLFDFQEKQTNIVNLFIDQEEYSFLLKYGRDTDAVEF